MIIMPEITGEELMHIDEAIKSFTGNLTEFRGRVESDLKQHGTELADTKEQAKKLATDLAESVKERNALAARLEAQEKATEQLEAKLERAGSAGKEQKSVLESADFKTFYDYLQRGDDSGYREYQKNLLQTNKISEQVLTEGGVFVVPEISMEIMKKVVDLSPLRRLSRVIPVNTNEWQGRKRTGRPTAYWVGESERPTETAPSYGLIRIPVRKMGVATQVTRDQLADAAISMEAELYDEAATAFAVAEGTAFLTGSGVDEPEGILTNADVSSVTGSDTSNHLVTYDDFVELKTTLKSLYRPGSYFVFNSNILARVMKLQDGAGHYIFVTDFSTGEPARILGHPFEIDENLDDDGTLGNDTVLFGNFPLAYKIIDRAEIEVLRDPYSAKPDLEFDWYKRLGARVWNDEAIKVLTMG